eukprot:7388603-Prymnesium_polylepis.1
MCGRRRRGGQETGGDGMCRRPRRGMWGRREIYVSANAAPRAAHLGSVRHVRRISAASTTMRKPLGAFWRAASLRRGATACARQGFMTVHVRVAQRP